MPPAELSTDDRVRIMDLLARYARCLDSGNLDGYVSLFTPDAVLFDEHIGRDNIRAYVDGIMQRRATDPARRMHFVGQPTIDGTNERVTVHSYLLWVQFGTDSPVSAVAEYVDECVKLDGHWLFQTRVLRR